METSAIFAPKFGDAYQFSIPLCDLLDPTDGRADLLDRYMVLGKAMTAGQGLGLYVLLSTNLRAT